jgi:hypothetical protein
MSLLSAPPPAPATAPPTPHRSTPDGHRCSCGRLRHHCVREITRDLWPADRFRPGSS